MGAAKSAREREEDYSNLQPATWNKICYWLFGWIAVISLSEI
jgi:hypothetical protein